MNVAICLTNEILSTTSVYEFRKFFILYANLDFFSSKIHYTTNISVMFLINGLLI